MGKLDGMMKDMDEHYFTVFSEKIAPIVGLALHEISVQMKGIKSHTMNIVDAYLGEKLGGEYSV
jgi:hypothetical protein